MIDISTHNDLQFSVHWPVDLPRPLQQSEGYGVAMRAMGSDVVRLVASDREGLVLEGLKVKRRMMGFVSLSTLFRGPLWHTDDAERRRAALQALRKAHPKHRWQLLAVMPDTESAEGETAALMRAAGLKRVMSGFSTIWQDLTADEDQLRANLHGKWRNQLKKAEQSGLQVNVSTKAKHQEWLLEKEVEQRDERSYQALPLGLVPLYRASEGEASVLGVTAHLSGQKVAGALMLLHGNSATYHVGWVGEAGRATCAHNLVLWQAILALKQRGIRFLDLGGLNTTQLKGLARFKLGMGGTPVTLPGSFL